MRNPTNWHCTFADRRRRLDLRDDMAEVAHDLVCSIGDLHELRLDPEPDVALDRVCSDMRRAIALIDDMIDLVDGQVS